MSSSAHGVTAETGDGLIVGNLLSSLRNGRSSTSAAFAGLAPAARHAVGLSDKTCAALRDDASRADLRRVGGVDTDAAGSAHSSFRFEWRHDGERVRPRSMVVARHGPLGPSLAMCQRVEAMPVIPE